MKEWRTKVMNCAHYSFPNTHSQFPWHLQRKAAKQREEGERPREREWEKPRNMNGRMEKKREIDWRLRPLSARVCQSVSVTVTGLQQWGTLNSSVHTAAHRGFTRLTDRQSQGLSCPQHITACSPAPRPDCTWSSDSPPPLFSPLTNMQKTFWYRISVDMMARAIPGKKKKKKKTWKWKLRCLYSFLKNRSWAV